MNEVRRRPVTPWTWVPSLYLAEGLPYVVVMSVATTMYKNFGLSNTDIALWTSWLYLPWMIKPLWSPFVDLLGTRRRWIWAMQLLIGGGLAGLAMTAPLPHAVQWTLAFFWLMAFSSATHDIAADGFYLLATDDKQQAEFVGIRTMFYRIASIFGQGLIVMLAGELTTRTGDVHHAWAVAMAVPDDGSGRMFVYDQAGLVWLVTGSGRSPVPVLDLRSRLVNISGSYDERGLLGLAAHTNFAQFPYL